MKSIVCCFFLIVGSVISCRTEKHSNLDVDSFVGVDLEGNSKILKEMNSPRLAINVYSPTCVPCFKEIPTLNYLRKEMVRTGLGEFFMVVDPYSITDQLEEVPFESIYEEAKKIMKEEVTKRGIELPILIMKPPFKVTPGKGLITGTPETLLFKTKPLILYYNFIGSISENENSEEIQNDLKVKFFKRVLGGI